MIDNVFNIKLSTEKFNLLSRTIFTISTFNDVEKMNSNLLIRDSETPIVVNTRNLFLGELEIDDGKNTYVFKDDGVNASFDVPMHIKTVIENKIGCRYD